MFKPMLAGKANERTIRFPVLVSPKFDGIRATLVNGKLVSRSLKSIPNDHIRFVLESIGIDGADGELIVGCPFASDVYLKSQSGVMTKQGKPDFKFYIFDNHLHSGGFSSRLASMAHINHERIVIVEHNVINNKYELDTFEAKCVAIGYEGVMLRSTNGAYKNGRSTENEGVLLKLKRFEDSEAEVLDVIEEMQNTNEGVKNEIGRLQRSSCKTGLIGKGTMGALTVRDLTSGIVFEIGCGFTAAQRELYFKLPPRIVKYKYFPMGMKDKPRHPVFIGERSHDDL